MKSRKAKNLLAGVVVLVILIICYFLIRNNSKEDEGKADNTTPVISISLEKIVSFSIGLEDQKNTFKKEDGIWYYNEDKGFPVDQMVLEGLISKLSSVEAVRVLDGITDLSEYGLDAPENVISVTDINGQETTLKVGNTNSSSNSCYLYLNDNKDKIFMVDSSFSTSFRIELYDLAEQDTFPVITGSTVQSLTVDRSGEQFIINKSTDSQTGWMVTGWDGRQRQAGSAQVSSELEKIASLAYNSYVDYKPSDMSLYGLDEPSLKIYINYEVIDETVSGNSEEDLETASNKIEKQLVLWVGLRDQNGDYYVKTEGSEGIYTMDSNSLEGYYNEDTTDFLSQEISNYSFADLIQLEIIRNQKSYILKTDSEEVITGEEQDVASSSQLRYYVNQTEMESTMFLNFYSQVSSMKGQSRLDYMPEGLGDPELKMIFTNKNGSTAEVQYFLYDSNFYLAADKEGNFYLVNKMNVKDMIAKFDSLISSIATE